MRKSYLLVLQLIIASVVFGQTPPDTSWKKGGFFGITFNQVSLSKDWAQGGQQSMSLGGNTNLFANYAKDKIEWSNELILNYAIVRSGSDYTKSDDRIEMNSKVGKKISEKWLLSFLMNFKTQFGPGYNYPNDSLVISDFMAPAYLTLSLGFTYKPVDYFEVMISPATGKFTFVNNDVLSDIGAYGVDTGKTIRSEFGAYLNARFQKDIIKNVNLLSKLELFNNYTDKNKSNASNVDVYWDTYLNMKVNDYITANLNFLLIYDANIIERTQMKQIFGVGFGYRFGYIPPDKK